RVLLALAILVPCAACTNDAAGHGNEPFPSEGESLQRPRSNTYTVDVPDYKPSDSPWDKLLSDDRLEDKKTRFDESIVHPNKIDGYLLNLSNAVIRLDVPIIKPDQDKELLVLHASYAAALTGRGQSSGGIPILPSVNLIDGLAK